MKIYYKAREIDYIKTLGGLEEDQSVLIHTSNMDITNIRNQVSKVSKNLGMAFTVNKTLNGAKVTRVKPEQK